MFPHAKVIYCQRDLRDIALSCWQTYFGAIRWANDWTEIARRFSDSLRVFEHWKTIPSIHWLDFPSSVRYVSRSIGDRVGFDLKRIVTVRTAPSQTDPATG